MTHIIPDTDQISHDPIDSGEHVGCMVPGCGDMAAILWVDKHHPWISILCAEHGRDSLSSTTVIANPVFFEACPGEVRALAQARVTALLEHRDEEYDS